MHLGGNLLADGDAIGAMQTFDAAWVGRCDLLPYLWQRGIALYYLRRCDGNHIRSFMVVYANMTQTDSVDCGVGK